MSNENRKFKGVWIPARLWLDQSIPFIEKVLLVEIDSLQDDLRGCFKSNKAFAEFFGLSPSRVSEYISSLASKGLIDIKFVKDGKRVVERQIFLTGKGAEVIAGIRKPEEGIRYPEWGIRDSEEGYSENAKERGNTLRSTPEGSSNTNGPSGDEPRELELTPPSPSDGGKKRAAHGYTPEFETAWAVYPKRPNNSKSDAFKAWQARINEGVTPDEMLEGLHRYREFVEAEEIEPRFIKQAATFFGPGRHWENDYTPTPPRPDRMRGPNHQPATKSNHANSEGESRARPTLEYI